MPDDVHLVSLAVGTVAVAADATRGAVRVLGQLPVIGERLRAVSARGERTVVAATALADAVLRAVVVKVVATALEEIDLTQLIRDNVDIDAVIEGVDLDKAVEQVDLDAAIRRVDLDGAIARVDLIALANFVIDGVDLPEIMRESTGSLSAEAVRGVRSHGMQADDAVSHFVGKLFGREPGREVTT